MKRFLVRLLLVVFALAAVAAALRLFVFDLVRIDSDEMWPSIGEGSWLVVNRRREPQRGDVILYRDKDNRFHVRRIIALPGESIRIIQSRPKVPGHDATLEEIRSVSVRGRPYKVMRETVDGRSYEILDDVLRTMKDVPETAVEKGFYVLADNREHSLDSRAFGVVRPDQVRGVVSWTLTAGDAP